METKRAQSSCAPTLTGFVLFRKSREAAGSPRGSRRLRLVNCSGAIARAPDIAGAGLPAQATRDHLIKGSAKTPVACAELSCEVTAKPAYTSAPIAIVNVVTWVQVMPSVDEDAVKELPLRSKRTQ